MDTNHTQDIDSDMTPEGLRASMEWHLRHTLAASSLKETDRDRYYAFARTMRDIIADRWMKTQDAYTSGKVRRAYYFSLEFLIGRLLGSNALNLGLYDACEKAMEGTRLDWQELQEQEADPGLGNGGLGRLAACFLDSMATLHLPVVGYGLRYDYGIFRQLISNGEQVEEPDNWKHDGYPWEIRRPRYECSVYFGGELRQFEKNGRPAWKWFPSERVNGIPYDIPAVGFGGRNVNNLRLWAAQACNDFDFASFNRGSYAEAVAGKLTAENLTKVLYPNDNIEQGKELRLRQQYFFVACSLHDIIRRHLEENGTLDNLSDKVVIQLNDTHPTLVIPELMRILVDDYDYEWERAWKVTVACTNYTNHTVLPEALEKWPVGLFRRLLPRHLQIIFDINTMFLSQVSALYPGDMDRLRRMSLVEEGRCQMLRMANLAVIGSTKVNGVAEIHSQILKDVIFRDFAQMWPDKFLNKTNGITQRRWLGLANRPLARLVTSRIGDGWLDDLSQLNRLLELKDDTAFLDELAAVKHENKRRLAKCIRSLLDIEVNPESLFDVQVKRLHEYKRQLLQVLYIISLYHRIKRDPDCDAPARTFIFAAKSAPGYAMAKMVIRLIHAVANVVNSDTSIDGRLKVVFLPDYRVSLAEIIIPGADLSEQISLAGTEASGTGNMKLMLNGALTMGTLDGANVEICNEVGRDNIFIFGMTAEEVQERKAKYSPWDIYHSDAEVRDVLDSIRNNEFSPVMPGEFNSIVQALLDFGDRYMLLADFRSFAEAQERAGQLFLRKREWTQRSLVNIACSGKFSSDRTIKEYNDDIWHLTPVLP